MIRERVSAQEMIHPLAHEYDLPAFRLSPQLVGVIPKCVMERYNAAKQATDQKFASTIQGIEARAPNVERASRDLAQRLSSIGGGSHGHWTRTTE
jgi:hypothetical protein